MRKDAGEAVVTAAWIGAVAVVVAAIVGGVFAYVSSQKDTNGNSVQIDGGQVTTTPAPGPTSRTPAPSTPPPPDVRFTNPDPAGAPAQVSMKQGVTLEGVARNLTAGHDLWIFDFDGSTYVRDTDLPLTVQSDGTWSFVDAPIGDKIGQRNDIILVDADPTCSRRIAGMRPDSDNTVAASGLPPGCPATSKVTVIAARP